MLWRGNGTTGRGLGLLSAVVAAAVGAAACTRKVEPVGSLTITPTVIQLPYPHDVALRLEWQPRAPLDKQHGNVTVFAHLLERPGKVVRTFDHRFPGEWKPGQPRDYEIDIFQSALGEELPPGTYLLTFGLYDDSVGYRWPLQVQGEDVGKREYQLATVEVPEDAPSPSFEFLGAWLPLAKGADRQILGRRGLNGAASIRVSKVDSPGTVRLAVNVPGSPAAPAVDVASDCAEVRKEAPAPGFSWIGFTVASSDGGPCELRFSASPRDASQSIPMSLEVLAWRTPQ